MKILKNLTNRMPESKARTVCTSHIPGTRGKSEPSTSYVGRGKNTVKLGQKPFQRYGKFLNRVSEVRVLSAPLHQPASQAGLFVRKKFLFALFSALTATVTATRLDRLRQQCIQPTHSLLLQRRKNMGVGVKGQTNLTMPKQFLDNFGMDSQ